MQSGTAIGLLVGGAVLLLAASPRTQPINGTAPVYGGALNPLNWGANPAIGQPGLLSQIFGNSANMNPNGGYSPAAPYQIPQGVQPSVTPAGGLQQGGYSPAAVPAGGYQQIDYTPPGGGFFGSPAYTPQAPSTPANDYFPVMTPMGGFQSALYMAPGGTAGGTQMAAASTPYQYA